MNGRKFKVFAALGALAIFPIVSAVAQVTLTGTNYTQNFNSLTNGLPPGWSVRTNATATSLGVAATFPTAAKSWADTTGEFGNCAALTNNAGLPVTGSESAATQATYTNRVLAVRQTGSFGDPGAAFVFQIASTTGFSNLTFSLDFCLLKSNNYSTTWTVGYAVGNTPAAFTTLGTYSDPGSIGTTNRSFALGTDANDQPNNVWIRVAALSAATGSGSRDTFGVDNFTLNYESAPATTAPDTLFIQTAGTNAVLTWADASFTLQAAPAVTGAYTNVIGASSPFTNTIDDPAKFYRLIH